MARNVGIATGVILYTILLATTSAQDVFAGSQCIISNTECTCSEQPPSGTCTRPVGKDTCLQGECIESFRCDCWGFEKCSINSCGKHVPLSGAVLSTDVPFPCEMETGGSQCRNPSGYMDTSESAENARDAAVGFVDEAVVDEREVAIELAAAMNHKMNALEEIRSLDRHSENVTDGELRAIMEDAELVAVTVQEIMIDLAEVVQESKAAYDHMGETKTAMRAAKVAEEAAKALDSEHSTLEAKASASSIPCTTCAGLREEAERLRGERRKRSKEAGESAKKTRDARKKTKKQRRSAQEKQEAAAAAKENLEEKVRRVLARLQAAAAAQSQQSTPETTIAATTTAPLTTGTMTTSTTAMATFQF